MKIKLMQTKQPKIFISNLAINKMNEYIDGINKEIGWLGTVTRDGLQFYIEDVFLFKQEVHSTTTEITPEGLNEFAMELMNTEGGMEIWNNMKLWGHSHVNMGVNPSGQDDKQIETFESCGYDFFIRIICNKRGEVRLDLYDYTTGIIYQELDYTVDYSDDELELKIAIEEKIQQFKKLLEAKLNLSEVEKEAIKSEIKDKVTEKTHTVPGVNYTNNYYGGSYYGASSGHGVHSYQSWWDDNEPVKKNINETNVTSEEIDKVALDAELIFDEFTAPETFEAYMHLESGGHISEITVHQMDVEVQTELEALVYEYVYGHYDDYKEYLYDTEVL